MRVTPDGRRVVAASEDRTLKVWDLETGRPLATLTGHAHGVNACAVTPDGRRVVSASNDKTLKVWDLETGHPLATLESHTDRVTACAVTPDGRRVVSASSDSTLKIWDLETGTCLITHRGDAPYSAVATSATAIVGGMPPVACGFSTGRHLPRVTEADASPRGRGEGRVEGSPQTHVLRQGAWENRPSMPTERSPDVNATRRGRPRAGWGRTPRP